MVLLDSPWINAKVKAFDNKYEATRNSRLTSDYDQYSLIPATVPISTQIEASLVLRRPDLQLAELQAHAQSSQIGIAEADLYHNFHCLGLLASIAPYRPVTTLVSVTH